MIEREIVEQAIDLLSCLKGKEKALLATQIKTLSDFRRLDKTSLSQVCGRTISLKKMSPNQILGKAETLLAQNENNPIGYVTLGREDYPQNLAVTADPPYRLYFRGVAPRYDWEGIAVVGTRLPTSGAKSEAYQFGMEMAMLECPLISGLALGIDGEAHKGAIAAKGCTIAVLGSGVDMISPKKNLSIARDILIHGGTIVSEYPPGTPGAPWRYPARNRIIAGLSQAVVVIQAPRKSGSLITSDFALQEGRDVVVTPSGVWAEGTASLIRDGAPVVESALEVLRELNIDTKGFKSPRLPEPSNRKELVDYMNREIKEEVINHAGHYYNVS